MRTSLNHCTTCWGDPDTLKKVDLGGDLSLRTGTSNGMRVKERAGMYKKIVLVILKFRQLREREWKRRLGLMLAHAVRGEYSCHWGIKSGGRWCFQYTTLKSIISLSWTRTTLFFAVVHALQKRRLYRHWKQFVIVTTQLFFKKLLSRETMDLPCNILQQSLCQLNKTPSLSSVARDWHPYNALSTTKIDTTQCSVLAFTSICEYPVF